MVLKVFNLIKMSKKIYVKDINLEFFKSFIRNSGK